MQKTQKIFKQHANMHLLIKDVKYYALLITDMVNYVLSNETKYANSIKFQLYLLVKPSLNLYFETM